MSETTQQESNTQGITDLATREVLVLDDNKLTVKGDVKVYGVLDAGLIRTTEIIANQRYEKQFLEFANTAGGPENTGFLWTGAGHNKQFIFKKNPDRFFATESIDVPGDQSYLVDSTPVLSATELGRGVVTSNLQQLGTLKKLTVGGNVNIADHVYFNASSQRVSIGKEDTSALFTIYDYINDVELVLNSNDKYAEVGTNNTKGLQLITDNQSRVTVEVNGDVTVGHEQKDSTVTRVYGKLSVGVKNPKEQFEVAGNIRWANKLFAVGNQPPVEGNFNQGDTIWNSEPKPQSYIGWVCTQGGTPGLWSPFGLIA
jgi:hypothetical protein